MPSREIYRVVLRFTKTVFVRKKQLAVVSEFAYLNLQNG